MSKSGLIIPLALALLSGCVISNDGQIAAQKNELSSATVNQAPVSAADVSARLDPAPAMPAPTPSRDEIRQLQTRLREIGFDPGPVDGRLSDQTKQAYARLHAGCNRLQPVIAGLEQQGVLAGAHANTPNPQEVSALQSKLRRAGFDPGPIDGIWGVKSSAALSQAKDSCQWSEGFTEIFKRPSGDAAKRTAAKESVPANFAPPLGSPGAENRLATPKAPPAHTKEEILILQLRLRDAGYDPGPFDGVMGPKTKMALEQLEASQRNGQNKSSLTAGITDQH